MGTKSRKNNWIRSISLDFRVIVGTAILWIVVQLIDSLIGLFYWSPLLFILLNYVLAAIFVLTIAGKGYLFFTKNAPKQASIVSIYLDLLRKYVQVWKGISVDSRITLKMFVLFLLTAIAGISVWRLITYPPRYELFVWIPYIVLYILIVIPYSLHKLTQLMQIVNGTKEIAQGNIQATIPVQGEGVFPRLAGYINNMKVGYQNALEDQIKSERLKTELITNVSHDLKTPLTSIINYIDLLKKEQLESDRANSYVDILDRKALRLKLLIEDLFEVSKMTSGTVELDIQTIDVATLLTQAIAEFSSNLGTSLEVREKIAKPHIYAELDGNKIWRVFENLIGNAKKYSLPGTRIYIYLDESDHRVLLKIQNTSSYEIDFPPDELFERFKRADESRQTEGSGLGLAIVRSIVDLHGGDINIEIHGDQFNVLLELPKTRL
ncbi:sensor histidine kinase [Paenibacillus agri]|uniref:histidine kinase n=1 Tax=Paenibacillus agri TaxID=2744309 RepID=A0A850EYN3_9BACL|nr:HAMP domain-containing sensor histidine kinase [Paenibacillus agri]NUU64032.1 HAMP domain-containing histidine kinase [Paenibacillus agri]